MATIFFCKLCGQPVLRSPSPGRLGALRDLFAFRADGGRTGHQCSEAAVNTKGPRSS